MKYYSNYNTFVHSMKKTGRLQDPTTLTTTLASPTMARNIHSLVVHYNKHSLVHWQGSMVQVGQWMRYSMKLWWPGAKYLLCRARLSWHLCTLVDREAWRCLRNVSWCCLLIYLFQEQLLSSGPCSGMKNHNQRLPCAWWTRIPDAELPPPWGYPAEVQLSSVSSANTRMTAARLTPFLRHFRDNKNFSANPDRCRDRHPGAVNKIYKHT